MTPTPNVSVFCDSFCHRLHSGAVQCFAVPEGSQIQHWPYGRLMNALIHSENAVAEALIESALQIELSALCLEGLTHEGRTAVWERICDIHQMRSADTIRDMEFRKGLRR